MIHPEEYDDYETVEERNAGCIGYFIYILIVSLIIYFLW